MTRPPCGIAAFIFLLVGLATSTLALQANLAGVIDWHVPLIGKPLLKPTPPNLVETALGNRGVLITEKNVLAVLDQQGSVVWRQRLEDDDPVVSYHVVDNGETHCISFCTVRIAESKASSFYLGLLALPYDSSPSTPADHNGKPISLLQLRITSPTPFTSAPTSPSPPTTSPPSSSLAVGASRAYPSRTGK